MATEPTPVSQQEKDLAGLAPAERQFVLLSGLGFYRLTRQRRKQLRYIVLGTTVAFWVGLAILGGWVVMRSRAEKQTIFSTPPPVRTYDARKLEHQVKLQKQQRSSSRPSMMPRIVSMKMSELSLPEIKVDPRIIHTTFQPKFKAVSGKGLGAGLGTGYGTHGFGQGVSTVDFFGIRARGEKIAILVDVSISMIEQERGGVSGYARVKQRVEQVIEALSDASMFNVYVFADAASAMEPDKVVIANDENKKRAKLFVRPYNTTEQNSGLTQGNVKQSSRGVKAYGGTTRLDLPLTAAFEHNADTILIISDGMPMVKKGFSADQRRAWQDQQQQWGEAHAGELAAWDARWGAGGERGVADKVWIPPKPAQTGPVKEGVAYDKGHNGYWQVVHAGGYHPRPQAPPLPDAGYWTLADFVQHLRILYDALYKDKGQKPPVIHCIYQIDAEGNAFLQGLSREYQGKYRRVQKIRD